MAAAGQDPVKAMAKFRESTATRHREQTRDLLQAIITSLVLGDSIFERWLWDPRNAHLRERLRETGILAKGGDTTKNLAWRLLEDTLDREKLPFPALKKVILSIGLNDMKEKDAGSTGTRIMHIVRRLRERFPDLPIYVLAIPSVPLGEQKKWDVAKINEQLENECSSMPGVVYTVPWTGIDKSHFIEDGVHFTGEGNDILFKNLSHLLESKPE
jgi:lysophospholipase L1-like esterase